MNYYDQTTQKVLAFVNSDEKTGLTNVSLKENSLKYGYNRLTEKKKKSIIKRVGDSLKEPMLLILLFGFIVTLGVNIGKFLKTGDGDFVECFGILFAVILSVSITVVMEGSSQKAFESLNKIYENLTVKVIRDGQIIVVDRRYVTVGDVIFLETGDKIIADGRLLESEDLLVDESMLTGESLPSRKNALSVLTVGTPLAERRNMVYSGSFVTNGRGKMVVTAVGDATEMGKIADEISTLKQGNSPLQQKLTKLGKSVTLMGAFCALVILVLSTVRLVLLNAVTFENIQDLLVSSIVLIVAAVPEGLPTIVAVSLALNMIKLASENALIKKMTATETAGAVSVICSDKTGTLTQNKMTLTSICTGEYCIAPESLNNLALLMNFACNNTAEIIKDGRKTKYKGSATETALLKTFEKNKRGYDYRRLRTEYPTVHSIPFSSERKYMLTTVKYANGFRSLIKGAPEKVLSLCSLSEMQRTRIMKEIQEHQQKAERILCFAHFDGDNYERNQVERLGEYVYDGFVALKDPVRPEVRKAINDCKRAGISVKILTGDNMVTALAVARELGIASDSSGVINSNHIENMTDEELKKILPKITVIARSTPIIKLRVVRLLKSMGEVVAVTGDGINDAPAIKHADVGIAMGVSGSDITKETADVVLLDDSFATVVKTVSFGRNVYKNLQRFILFQLSVNVSALLYITICAILGLPSPFNTLQLLWINVIMDGPPALTLGLEKASDSLMNAKPVKRKDGIVGKKTALRILFNGVFICLVMVGQTLTNFLGASVSEQSAALFTLFITMQLFNAFNSKELGSKSIFGSLGKNKIMFWTFAGVFLLHVAIINFLPTLFGVSPMRFITWVKCVVVAFSIILVVEIYKLVYRLLTCKRNVNQKNTFTYINKIRRKFKRCE